MHGARAPYSYLHVIILFRKRDLCAVLCVVFRRTSAQQPRATTRIWRAAGVPLMGNLLSRAHPPAAPVSPQRKATTSNAEGLPPGFLSQQTGAAEVSPRKGSFLGQLAMTSSGGASDGGSSGLTTQQSSCSSLSLTPTKNGSEGAAGSGGGEKQFPADNPPSPTIMLTTASSSSDAFRAPSPTSCDDAIDESRALEGWVPSAMYERVEEIGTLYKFGECIGRGLDSVVFRGDSVADSAAAAAAAGCSSSSGDGGGSLDDRLNGAVGGSSSGSGVAIKVLQKRRLMNKEGRKMHKLRGELAIWQKLRHPSIITLQKVDRPRHPL